MKTYLDLAPVPLDETCQSLGDGYDPIAARAECRRMRDLMLEKFSPPGNATIVIKSNPHDFGNYLSVECCFDDEVEEEYNWALLCENSLPLTWED